MRPAPFDYRAPDTLDEALAVLGDAADDVSVLAGGQSLVPMLNMRIARPDLVLDLGRIAELTGVERRNGVLRIGAMTRQRAVETDPTVRAQLPLLPAALRHVAHLAIRTRGTIGGSLVHADPSAELPAAVAALEGRVELRAAAGARVLALEDFLLGPLMTARAPGELLAAVEIPVPAPGTGWGFAEVASTHGAFALAGAAAVLRLDRPGGVVEHVRLTLLGVAGTPVTPDWVAPALAGRPPAEEALAQVGARLRDTLEPRDDAQVSAAYRRRAAAELAVRVLRDAARRAEGQAP